MAIVSSGTISIQSIVNEFGGSAPHSLSEYYGVAAGIPSSGTISISHFYGKSACYTAGTNTLLYSNTTSGSQNGEGFFRTLQQYTTSKCGTYNLQGYYQAGYARFTKQIQVRMELNGTSFSQLYSVGGGSPQRIQRNYNINSPSTNSGDVIRMRGFLWGGHGSDGFDGSSLFVRIA